MNQNQLHKLNNVYGAFEGNKFYPRINIPSGVLRVVVSTKCNYNCSHCFKEGEVNQCRVDVDAHFIARIFEFAVKYYGIHTARLTGGEPLMYLKLDYLLKRLREIGVKNIDITTNGFFLQNKLGVLLKHHVNPITVTLNTLNPERYSKIAKTTVSALDKVLKGILKANESGLRINLNLTALDNVPLKEIIEVIEFAQINELVIRICEPTYVVGAKETKQKKRFKEVVKYLNTISDQKINSLCESVDYISTKSGGKVTIMRNLCDNRYCDSCAKYLYIRLTSKRKLKPCLSRTDTEVQIPKNPTDDDLQLCFAKAVAYMGKGLQGTSKKGLVLK